MSLVGILLLADGGEFVEKQQLVRTESDTSRDNSEYYVLQGPWVFGNIVLVFEEEDEANLIYRSSFKVLLKIFLSEIIIPDEL